MSLAKNQTITLTITALSNDGSGVGRFDGQAVFVPYTAVGDVLEVKIVKAAKSYAFGILQRILTPSSDRVSAACPLYTKCGGCCFAHLSYEAELRAKASFVADAMRRIGGFSFTSDSVPNDFTPDVPKAENAVWLEPAAAGASAETSKRTETIDATESNFEKATATASAARADAVASAKADARAAQLLPILPSPQAEHYRNKVQFPVVCDASGVLRAGFFAPRSHRVLPCENCTLQPPILNEIAQTACALFTERHLSAYDEATGNGLVRHIFLRHAVTTGKVMVCFVINGTALPQEKELCDVLLAKHPCIETIVLNTNTNRTNVILGEACRTLYGSGVLHDTLAGVPVALSALSFYQVNTEGANRLYAAAARLAAIQPHETLLDLYCGAGTIGLSMARQCKRLIGVEIIPQAVENAKRNAAEMGISHAEFLCSDAGKAAQALAAKGLAPDIIVLDPPRKGCDDATLDAVVTMAPARIVMVSCNAATAARDAKLLAARGYVLQAVQPVDLFPRTKHVETIVLLQRENS